MSMTLPLWTSASPQGISMITLTEADVEQVALSCSSPDSKTVYDYARPDRLERAVSIGYDGLRETTIVNVKWSRAGPAGPGPLPRRIAGVMRRK